MLACKETLIAVKALLNMSASIFNFLKKLQLLKAA